jgi:tetratricopeptide (TPR) repeat protein
MKSTLSLLLLTALAASAQVERIVIPAGSPQDQTIQAISNENDAQKRVAMLQDFVQKFASDPQAVAYGYSQLSQQYFQQGDTNKAMESGEKALAAQPKNLEIIVSVVSVAQKMNASEKVVDLAVRGGTVFDGIAKQTKPDGMSDEQFAGRIKSDQDPYRQSYEFLENCALNALTAETNERQRMADIERFNNAFPNSPYEEQILELAVYSLGQLKDPVRLASFADKAIARNPNSISTLVVLASTFAEQPDAASTTRAETYARKVIDLSRSQPADDPAKQKLYSGIAHSALGYCLMKQEKTAAAIPELKTATTELQGQKDPYSIALFRLGFAYAKSNQLALAKPALTEAAGIEGPYQQAARDLLTRIASATKTKVSAKR